MALCTVLTQPGSPPTRLLSTAHGFLLSDQGAQRYGDPKGDIVAEHVYPEERSED